MNNGFDRPEDLQRMQQEAIRRVQEMQARARSSLEKSQPAPEPAQQQGRRPAEESRVLHKRILQRKLPASLNQKLKHYIKEYHK